MANPKEDSEKEEEDKVAAAYENISKKLDSIRNGKEDEEEESKESDEPDEGKDEPDLEEWKGPKPPEKDSEESKESDEQEEEVEEDDLELRKVKLGGGDDDKGEDDEDDEEDEDEKAKDADEEELEPPKKWKPVEDDPLDEDAESDDEKEKDIKADDLEEENSETSEKPEHSNIKRSLQPDTLDDLTAEEDFDIPNLKGSRQEGSNIGYNAPSEKSSMDNNDPNNFFSQHNQTQTPKRANKFHLLVLVLIGVAVIGFTVYILKGGFGEINISNTPSPSPSAVESPSATPTPTPEPELSRGDFTIRVLNGTSTTGLAGSASAKLKDLGYNTANPGNATNSAFTQTLVRVKEGDESQNLLQRLIADLAPDYSAEQGPDLSDNSTNDAEVILGTK